MNLLFRHRPLMFCVLIASTSAPTAARAGFVASDLSPTGAYNLGNGYNLTGPQAFTGQGYGLAVEFTVGGTSPVAFGSAELAIAYRAGSNSFNVVLASDNGDQPGATLETITETGIAPGPTLVTATSTVHTMLAAGSSYWLEALATGNTNMTWMANTQGVMNDLNYRLDTGSGPGAWNFANGYADPAFAVLSSVATFSTVPEPTSLSLMALGLIGLVTRTAFRKFLPG